jgi:hypothetical protein
LVWRRRIEVKVDEFGTSFFLLFLVFYLILPFFPVLYANPLGIPASHRYSL